MRAGLVPEAPAQAAVSKLAFDLPWPWRGERFDGSAFARLNYLVGPLFSGKGQFARRLQASLPNTRYAEDAEPEARRAEAYALLDADPVGRARVPEALAACGVDLPPDALARLQPAAHRPGDEVDGLIAVLTWLWADPPLRLIVDVPERGIGGGLQAVVRAEIRRWVASQPERMLFVVTRSRGVLDLSHIQPDEAVFLFPANHAPPSRIAPFPGSFGYEAAASCLADPDHRASVEGATVVRRRASAA